MVDSRPQSSARVLTRSRDPWDGDLSPPPETLPRPFNAAKHQINVRRFLLPLPAKLIIWAFYTAELRAALCLCKAAISAQVNKKTGGGAPTREVEFSEGGNLRGARRGWNCDGDNSDEEKKKKNWRRLAAASFSRVKSKWGAGALGSVASISPWAWRILVFMSLRHTQLGCCEYLWQV